MSIEEFANTTPVRPPNVKRKRKPKVHRAAGVILRGAPYKVASQLKILIPVGTAIIIVAAVK